MKFLKLKMLLMLRFFETEMLGSVRVYIFYYIFRLISTCFLLTLM